jgi:hypothetical protein
MDDRIRELEQAIEEARHELAHVRFDLEGTRREREEARSSPGWQAVNHVGLASTAAVLVIRNGGRPPYAYACDSAMDIYIAGRMFRWAPERS